MTAPTSYLNRDSFFLITFQMMELAVNEHGKSYYRDAKSTVGTVPIL